ncbi:nitric oxide reductase activation protein NorD [Kistimonas asteriae]|uniref:nitric oxide reductase activation protein NorD n=1 Tax=Kistimonas asteriae TaxID=517724 RepID=UPI001BA6A7C4|nr:VWA domain-containing protein [Kistimonas asteriae]
MEEYVGSLWHRLITRSASQEYAQARVCLQDVGRSVATLFRALGGDRGLRIEASAPRDYLTWRSLLARIAGTGRQVSLAWRDDESLRLPESIALFPEPAQNRELYLWLAALASKQPNGFRHWGRDNQQHVVDLLQQCPGLRPRYQRLVSSYMGLRPDPGWLPEGDARLERAIQQALLDPGSVQTFPASNRAPWPVLLWLYPSTGVNAPVAMLDDDDTVDVPQSGGGEGHKRIRKQGAVVDDPNGRDGLLLFRLENLFSWSEYSSLDRTCDDSEDEDVGRVADDLDIISVSRKRQAGASRLKLDLDLPAAINDDLPLGDGILLPEWDFRRNSLREGYCLLQPMLDQRAEPMPLPGRLIPVVKQLRARFETLKPERQWLRRQPEGDEVDLDAWLDFQARRQQGDNRDAGLYRRFSHQNRDLCCLLLADLSMSTEAYINNDYQVIDVIRDSLLLFSEALSAVGDRFALYGFSSVKRHQVRFNLLKNFGETYDDRVRGRLQSLRPGYYTRMGAAIRQATKILMDQGESRRLLLLISDGKPNDIDHYEGRYGVEDTRMAIIEARQQGLLPFCITIDQEAEAYLPYLFGSDGFSVIHRPAQLPRELPLLYSRLTGGC